MAHCRRGRLQGAVHMYLLQNAGVCLSAAAVLLLLWKSYSSDNGVYFWLLVACTIVCGSAASVGGMGSTLAIERQWTKALCRGDSAALSAMNAGASLSMFY